MLDCIEQMIEQCHWGCFHRLYEDCLCTHIRTLVNIASLSAPDYHIVWMIMFYVYLTMYYINIVHQLVYSKIIESKAIRFTLRLTYAFRYNSCFITMQNVNTCFEIKNCIIFIITVHVRVFESICLIHWMNTQFDNVFVFYWFNVITVDCIVKFTEVE